MRRYPTPNSYNTPDDYEDALEAYREAVARDQEWDVSDLIEERMAAENENDR